ncbi:lantibiotic dehydratase C-terminal domain-containing protein [Bacillus cereus]|uniref:lantibiotic dehydratase C-terminal domain-containing protein n=1 Tax=Bacillus cereus TaxID=1396 RepID=UPI000BEC3F69|nr:lantibiotic dehydratase C-terminal domain-containing protein [Bacillus cereus]PEE38307.1 hypothetical protein CON59_05450 [Bacillus cereus]PET51311.1 hypothetical protein CN523_03485 [Bacillus cereus]PEV82429.1 hypothetical protein CN429_14530 [Bacillus cereus]PFA56785.1 hypothetical protein CN389_11385 [Bacillus cereus]PFD76837.1 hypothetical protein CN271_08070 [Bacillus cereus]
MWKSIFVYYYDNYDNLIRELIPKLLPNSVISQEFPNQIKRFYFTRHWIGGPHIRLNFDINENADWETLYRTISLQIEGFLREYPSKSILVDENWHKNTSVLLRLEHQKVRGNEMELHPDNYWKMHDYEIRSSMYGGEKGAKLAEDFYSDATHLICELFAYTKGKLDDRIDFFIQMMVALVGCTHVNFYYSYRSHFEGHMHPLKNKVEIKDSINKSYLSKKDWYVSLVKKTFHQVERIKAGESVQDNGILKSWVELVTRYYQLIMDEVQLGLSPFHTDVINFSSISDFHQEANENQIVQEFFSTSYFQVQRFLLSFMYGIFNFSGITPIKRAYLCYIAAESIEIVTGKNWDLILREAAEEKKRYMDNGVNS